MRPRNRVLSRFGIGIGVAVVLFFTLFPVYWMVSSAFDKKGSSGGQSLLPQEPSLDNFAFVLTDGGFGTFLRNSLVVALVTVLVSAFVCLLAAVAVARFRFKFRTSILLMILVVQMVPLEALVIPLFLQVKSLGRLNSLFGLIVVYVALAFGIWMLRGFAGRPGGARGGRVHPRRELVADVPLRAAVSGHARPRRDDVNTDPRNPVIGVRSFGADADLVSRHVAAEIEGIQGGGVAACVKHFPGHGDTHLDSHHDLLKVDLDPEEFARVHLAPSGRRSPRGRTPS